MIGSELPLQICRCAFYHLISTVSLRNILYLWPWRTTRELLAFEAESHISAPFRWHWWVGRFLCNDSISHPEIFSCITKLTSNNRGHSKVVWQGRWLEMKVTLWQSLFSVSNSHKYLLGTDSARHLEGSWRFFQNRNEKCRKAVICRRYWSSGRKWQDLMRHRN